jgi:uncharacterized protein
MQRRFSRRRSAIHGYGVFALRPLHVGERLLEYRGRRLDQAEVSARFGQSAISGHTFLFSLNARYHIDGSDGGNLARWINHSCDPNCEAMIYVDINGDERRDRVYIQALRAIDIGEELSFDYAIELSVVPQDAMRAAWQCGCGAPCCRGSMLAG